MDPADGLRRGLDRLVVRGFLSEIVQQIKVAELEDRLQLAIEAELAGSAGQTGSSRGAAVTA